MKSCKASSLLAWALLILTNPSPALGQSGRIERGLITRAALADNLFGDSTTKPYRVYLPLSYDTTQQRYPVIYVLHGFPDDETALLSPLKSALDSMIRQRKVVEMIAVFANGSNRLGGSLYLSSPVIGDFETYIVRDLVSLIDSKYRTLNQSGESGSTWFLNWRRGRRSSGVQISGNLFIGGGRIRNIRFALKCE